MRPLALALLLLAGCGYPVKIHPFHLNPGQSDVVWIYIDGMLRRCTMTDGQPVCVRALMMEPFKVTASPEALTPAARPKAKQRPAPELPAIE